LLRLLEVIRTVTGESKHIRLYQTSSSEMFGMVREIPQKENTPLHPRSPYACGKVYAFYRVVSYRDA
jgi:GDPmannose 4,6-dehydratase